MVADTSRLPDLLLFPTTDIGFRIEDSRLLPPLNNWVIWTIRHQNKTLLTVTAKIFQLWGSWFLTFQNDQDPAGFSRKKERNLMFHLIIIPNSNVCLNEKTGWYRLDFYNTEAVQIVPSSSMTPIAQGKEHRPIKECPPTNQRGPRFIFWRVSIP